MRIETKDKSPQRLSDAVEFLDSANANFFSGRYKAALGNAADAAIAANDAFTMWFIGKVATADHLEAVKLHREAGCRLNENKSHVLGTLLDMRHIKAYKAVTVSKTEAEAAVRQSNAFVGWVKEKIAADKGVHHA
ncbi:MAG: hypothetical protein NT016_01085 [Candidatus Aenigmarchaeota archaeon]|nr:hypothetical protein [Candidatus Aenigmarchaeota archaeon]